MASLSLPFFLATEALLFVSDVEAPLYNTVKRICPILMAASIQSLSLDMDSRRGIEGAGIDF